MKLAASHTEVPARMNLPAVGAHRLAAQLAEMVSVGFSGARQISAWKDGGGCCSRTAHQHNHVFHGSDLHNRLQSASVRDYDLGLDLRVLDGVKKGYQGHGSFLYGG